MTKRKHKSTINIIVYFTLRILVLISLIGQAIRGNWNNVFLCILTLILFTLPTLLTKKFKITVPQTLEIVVYLFIYAAEILGEIQNFYGIFLHWDTMLHTLNGFIAAAVGFSLIDILNHNKNFHINMSPAFASLVAVCFSMSIGVIWEFAEYAADRYLEKDMQKDVILNKITSIKLNKSNENIPVTIDNIDRTIIVSNNSEIVIENGYLELGINDTIKDLFVNFIGAVIFSIFGYLYVKNRKGKSFLEVFLLKITNETT